MINIGTTDFYLAVPSLPREEFELYSTSLFDEWEVYAAKILGLSDYSLFLNVEEGSISAKGKVAATVGALYLGIAQYGSFVSGVKALNEQIHTVGGYLSDKAYVPFKSSNIKPRIRKSGGALTRLETLFVKVRNGEITVEEAMKTSERILGPEIYDEPEFINSLQSSLESTPSQTHFPFEDIEQPITLRGGNDKERNPKQTKPSQPIIRPDQYRVEVWRESKRGKKNVRVIKL